MKKRTIRLVIFAILLILIIDIFVHSLRKGTVTITVPKGSSSTRIAEILKENDLIQSKTYFLARLYLSPYRGKLQYGKFKFDKNTSLSEIIKKLSTEGAKKDTVTITIPEGYSVEKICDTLVDAGLVTATEFESACKKKYDFSFINGVPKTIGITYSLQGFLYPSTYEFYTDTTAEAIIEKMLLEFEKQVKPLNISDSEIFEIVTKASLIEREAKLASEKAKIAGVLENRLKANIRLQIDATVVYAKTHGKYDVKRVYKNDLNFNSKYNTYKVDGLPVGPICCPSVDSIKAAQNPEKHNYLYYHTDTKKNDGSHIFTETLTEHNKTK